MQAIDDEETPCADPRYVAGYADGKIAGERAAFKKAGNWLKANANAEKEPAARKALIEAYNAILAQAECRA